MYLQRNHGISRQSYQDLLRSIFLNIREGVNCYKKSVVYYCNRSLGNNICNLLSLLASETKAAFRHVKGCSRSDTVSKIIVLPTWSNSQSHLAVKSTGTLLMNLNVWKKKCRINLWSQTFVRKWRVGKGVIDNVMLKIKTLNFYFVHHTKSDMCCV